jgi:hypothetical protein
MATQEVARDVWLLAPSHAYVSEAAPYDFERVGTLLARPSCASLMRWLAFRRRFGAPIKWFFVSVYVVRQLFLSFRSFSVPRHDTTANLV